MTSSKTKCDLCGSHTIGFCRPGYGCMPNPMVAASPEKCLRCGADSSVGCTDDEPCGPFVKSTRQFSPEWIRKMSELEFDHAVSARGDNSGANQLTIDRLTRERDAALEYVKLFVQRSGVTQVSGGANHAEVALCKLDELLEDSKILNWMESYLHELNDIAILSDDEDGVWAIGGRRWHRPLGVERGKMYTYSRNLLSGDSHHTSLREALREAMNNNTPVEKLPTINLDDDE